MREKDLLKAAKIVLLGFGAENKGMLEYLKKKDYKGGIIVADERGVEKREGLVAYEGKDFTRFLDEIDDKSIVIRSPGFRINHPIWEAIRKRGAKVTTGTNVFFANFRGRIIGVTGSKGKSTTSSLIDQILARAGLESSLAGNIGRPMIEIIDSDLEFAVLELSSYQLSDLNYSPEIAVITSFFPEHLDWHGGQKEYFAAKTNIAKDARLIFYPTDDDKVRMAMSKFRGEKREIERGSFEMELRGKHNQMNVSLAAAVARELGVSEGIIGQSISEFDPLDHRLERIGVYNKIIWIDDAISTTPESTLAAMEAFAWGKIDTLMLGGTDRGLDFSDMVREIRERKIPRLVLFPESGVRIKEELESQDFQGEILETRSMEEAVEWANEKAEKGSIVMLSCASPSYSLWNNFEEKGDEFQRLVRKITDENG